MNRNNLHLSKSPYLQQHALNPVHWQAWNSQILAEAKEADHLLIISIGYSACHWCHVMEREVFEHEDAAEVMNRSFVSIKVDREERPDIDEIYMRALQLMNGQGGWPLNVVCLPDGKPIWGATYVPKDRWIKVLNQLAEMYQEDRDQVLNYANQLTEGIRNSMLVSLDRRPLEITASDLDTQVKQWSKSFDYQEGGSDRAPKFPMPVNWNFLLEFGVVHENEAILNQVELSLDKMAMGGIYDQIGGGFARYSVDARWKVPHFEKMLYDNAQLISLYSKAFRHFKKDIYREVVEENWAFLKREMLDKSGAWYSALDADSEGEEGKFYIWQGEELQSLIPVEDWAIFSAYYSINDDGYWEKGNYILLRKSSDEEIAKRFGINAKQLKEKVNGWKELLMTERSKRTRPGLDNKALCSWNALMITAACEAYQAFKSEDFLQSAIKTAAWILDSQSQKDDLLLHAWQEGESHIEGLLEDYAFSIEAFIHLWQCSGEEQYLKQAEKWSYKVIAEFEDKESGLFFTRPKNGEALISPSLETQDNVIPSANSTMAHNLHRLGLVLGKSSWTEQAQQNLAHLKKQMLDYGESFANWSRLALYNSHDFYEIAIIGKESSRVQEELNRNLKPLEFTFHSEQSTELAVFQNRYVKDKTLIYPCQGGSCNLPYEEITSFRKDFK